MIGKTQNLDRRIHTHALHLDSACSNFKGKLLSTPPFPERRGSRPQSRMGNIQVRVNSHHLLLDEVTGLDVTTRAGSSSFFPISEPAWAWRCSPSPSSRAARSNRRSRHVYRPLVEVALLDTYGKASVATDLSGSSEPALRVALRWFSLRYLTLFHAFDLPYRGWIDDRMASPSQLRPPRSVSAGARRARITGRVASVQRPHLDKLNPMPQVTTRES